MYIITEETQLVIALTDELIDSGDSTFYDKKDDVIYHLGEFRYYDLEVPAYVRPYDYKYSPETGFVRAYTMEEIYQARIGLVQQSKESRKALENYNEIRENQNAIIIALAEQMGM